MVWKSEEEEAAVHVLTPDFQAGEFVLAADTATHGSLARVRVCRSAACMASTAIRLHLIYVRADLRFLFTPQ